MVELEDYRLVFIYEDAPPQSIPAIYLKLLALSTREAALRSLNLDGIFGKLENVAWVDGKPVELEHLRQQEIAMKLLGTFPVITSVDKFPRYLQHVIPDTNTRILDDSRVRLGAQLAPGTTVMPGASYINFNAGTLGRAMVEGRISSSVVVGEGTDIGGGASIWGRAERRQFDTNHYRQELPAGGKFVYRHIVRGRLHRRCRRRRYGWHTRVHGRCVI